MKNRVDKSLMKLKLFSLFILINLFGCGADKLKNSDSKSNIVSLTSTCSCTSDASLPVCDISKAKEYSNICLANCFGATQIKEGHCQCQGNKVCGDDGITYDECTTRPTHVKVIKYLACDQTPL